jgi:outer membrane protein assembly factor BamB
MAGNGTVFISHSHDDNARCAPLLAALDAWGVDYFFDTVGLSAGQQLSERVQRELTSRDIFLRICTAAVQRSFWMNLEVNAFRGLQAEDRKRGRGDRRTLINLILDDDYSREPFDKATLFIDGASRPRAVWLGELGRALGVAAPTKSSVSRRTVLAYGAAGVVTLSAAAAAGALYLDYSSRISAANALPRYKPGKIVWQIDHASGKKDVPPDPCVGADGHLYVNNGFAFTAYDPTHLSGGKPRQLWQQLFTTQNIFTAPVVYGGRVYFGTDYTLYALKTSDGSTIWTIKLPQSDGGNNFSTPLLAGGLMYELSDSGNLYAFNIKDGSVAWSVAIEAPLGALASTASGPAVDSTAVYIGSTDHTFYAYDARSGSPLWKALTRGKIISTPVVVNGVVYFGSGDNYVYALHTHDGSLKWKYLTGNDVQSTPSVTAGVVYIASNDGYLYTLDAETGKPYWRAPIGDYDPTSHSVSNSGPVTCQPAITGDAVSVIDRTVWVVRSYDRQDGTQRWFHQSADNVQNADPVADNGLILFGSGDQTLYAYGA